MADRPAPFLIADSLALDFLNSIATPVDEPVEWIASGEDLLDWLKTTEAVPDEVLAAMRRTAVPGQLDAVAAQARALREWFRKFVSKHMGKRLGPEAFRELAPLNRVLERDQAYVQIAKRAGSTRSAPHSGLSWQPVRHWWGPDALLLPIANAMASLICNEDFSRVAACEGVRCTLLFLDRTRRRRWCSMSVCGNRAKQATHRKLAQSIRPSARRTAG